MDRYPFHMHIQQDHRLKYCTDSHASIKKIDLARLEESYNCPFHDIRLNTRHLVIRFKYQPRQKFQALAYGPRFATPSGVTPWRLRNQTHSFCTVECQTHSIIVLKLNTKSKNLKDNTLTAGALLQFLQPFGPSDRNARLLSGCCLSWHCIPAAVMQFYDISAWQIKILTASCM